MLDGVSLEAPAGAITQLQGENGAGKTTLVRIVATLLQPDAGVVRVAGIDVVADPFAARAVIGLALASDRGFAWRLSGRENLRFAARTRGMRARAAQAAIDDLLERVGLAEIADRAAGRLSTGQRQRLQVARAVIGDPRVVLIDEPLRGLDRGGAAAIEALLSEHASRGAAVLVAVPDGMAFPGASVTHRLRTGHLDGMVRDA